jgi:hypothetical protein
VNATEPESAAELANDWAASMAERVNDLFSPGARATELFRAQADEAFERWQNCQKAVVSFQANNPERLLGQRLKVHEQSLVYFLEANRGFGLVLQDAKTLRDRLGRRERDAESGLSDHLATVFLSLRSLSSTLAPPRASGSYPMPPSSPVQLQFPLGGNSPFERTAGEQLGYLEELVSSIETQKAMLNGEAAKLGSQILSLQSQLEKAEGERQRLEEERNLAYEAYQVLARKAQEPRLSAAAQETIARVAGRAVTPSKKIRPRTRLNTALGGMLGFILGVLFVFISPSIRASEC